MDNLDDEITKLQERNRTLEAALNDTSNHVESSGEEEKKLQAAEAEMMKQVALLREKRRALENERQERAKKLKFLREEQTEANRRLQKLLNDQKLRDEYTKFSDELDRDTAGRPWREWAKPHQVYGAKQLAVAKRGLLGDKRGLGKTLTSLIYMDMVKARKTLIFTPKDVSENFASEVQRWTPDRHVLVLTSVDQVRRNIMLDGMVHVNDVTVVLNYEAWRKDDSLIQRLINIEFDTVVVDEAHKVKKWDGVAYEGIFRIAHAKNKCPACGGKDIEPANFDKGRKNARCATCLYEEADYWDFRSVKNILPMSGTMLINRPQDIWPHLHLVDPVHYHNLNNFLYDYCAQGGDGRWYYRYGGEERLLKNLGRTFIGRNPDSADVQMPPQKPIHHIVEFDPVAYPRQWKVMEQIRQRAAIQIADDQVLSVVGKLAQLIRMAQAITWPGGIKIFAKKYDPVQDKMVDDRSIVLYESDAKESIKIDKAEELIIEALEEGDRIVLFSRFKEALKETERRLLARGIKVVRYDGDISSHKAREAQLDFDVKTGPNHSADEPCRGECGKCPEGQCTHKCPNWDMNDVIPCEGYKYQVFLGQYQKAGTGLNLTRARQMIILDRYYADAYEDQARGRIQRLDSTMETIVHIITVVSPRKGQITVDEWMNDLIETKKKMTEGFDSAHLASEFMEKLANGELI